MNEQVEVTKVENELEGIKLFNKQLIVEIPKTTVSGIILAGGAVTVDNKPLKVVAVADDITKFKVGDYVLGAGAILPLTVTNMDGAISEYILIYESSVYLTVDKTKVKDAYFGTINKGHND